MNRILRVNQLLKEEVGKIIAKEVEFPENVFCTVTRAETSSNLRETKIYVSVMPDNKSKKVLQILMRQTLPIQKLINKKFVMRPVPKLRFVLEKKTKEAVKIERLLADVACHRTM